MWYSSVSTYNGGVSERVYGLRAARRFGHVLKNTLHSSASRLLPVYTPVYAAYKGVAQTQVGATLTLA